MEIDDVFTDKLKHELQNGADNQEILEDWFSVCLPDIIFLDIGKYPHTIEIYYL